MEAEGNRQFPLNGDEEVGKSGRRAAVQRVEIRRHVGQHFGALRDAETQSRRGSAEDVRALTDRPIHTVLRLKASIRSDPARIGDVGAVGINLRGAGGTAGGGKSQRRASQRGDKDAGNCATPDYGDWNSRHSRPPAGRESDERASARILPGPKVSFASMRWGTEPEGWYVDLPDAVFVVGVNYSPLECCH